MRLFQNLMSNAIKFRREIQPAIHLSVKQCENEWLFAVAGFDVLLYDSRCVMQEERYKKQAGARKTISRYIVIDIGDVMSETLTRRNENQM